MTSRPAELWLAEIIAAGEALAELVDGGRDQWIGDKQARRATYWLACVLGEAAKGYATSAGIEPGSGPWSAAARFRDRLLHRYYDIDDDEVWRAVSVRVPALVEDARAAVDEQED
ncbi:MAG: DUF86 domain-containing protein [Actinomycetota bacterium]|nr:DUF86 domain-containing protein [Actinomycetota bacterium]